jgi:hypothetical protein
MKNEPSRASENKKTSQVNDLLPLNFNVLIAGKITTPLTSACQNTIIAFFDNLKKIITPYNDSRYGFSGTDASYRILYSSENCNLPLEQWVDKSFSFYRVTPKDSDKRTQVTNTSSFSFNNPYPDNADANHELINWMMEQSDLFFTLWDGTKGYDHGSIWSLILQAAKKGIPVIWMNPVESDYFYVYQGGKSSLLDEPFLTSYCSELLGLSESDDKLNELGLMTRSIKTHKTAWSNFYKHFTQKYKVNYTFTTEDSLLEDHTKLPEDFSAIEEKYQKMKSVYKKADQIAVIENNNYRSALLFRAYLPFVANCVLIFGFYGYTIAGHYIVLSDLAWNLIIAGSFFLQAACNLGIIWLSDLNNHKGWHKLFVDQRYIAEVMRLAIHFTPINLPLNIGSASISSNKLSKDSPVSHFLRSVLRSTSINNSNSFHKEEKDFFFKHTIELLSHQIDYHQYTALKHKHIAKKLTQTAQILFWMGITVIVARVALQFVYIAFPQHFVFNSPERNLISAIANLLALVTPAAAATAYSILNLCGFRDLGQRSQVMVDNLKKLKEKFEIENQNEDVAYDDCCRLSKQVSTLLLQEATDWYALINTKKITKN